MKSIYAEGTSALPAVGASVSLLLFIAASRVARPNSSGARILCRYYQITDKALESSALSCKA